MGNLCSKSGDASASSLDTTHTQADRPVRTAKLRPPAKDTPDTSFATFGSLHERGNKSSPTTASNESSAIGVAMVSQSWSAASNSRKAIDAHCGSPLQPASTPEGVNGTATTQDNPTSATASMGPSTHHGQRASGASSVANDAMGSIRKAATPQHTSLTTLDHELTAHTNTMHDTVKNRTQHGRDPDHRRDEEVCDFPPLPSPPCNPLQPPGALAAAAYTPSTHVGPVLRSNSSSVVERDAATCDVHIEVDSSSLSDSACGFEVMLRALQPPTATERADAIRLWADLVPATPIA